MTNTWISILIMWLVTLAIRVLPVTLIRKAHNDLCVCITNNSHIK